MAPPRTGKWCSPPNDGPPLHRGDAGEENGPGTFIAMVCNSSIRYTRCNGWHMTFDPRGVGTSRDASHLGIAMRVRQSVDAASAKIATASYDAAYDASLERSHARLAPPKCLTVDDVRSGIYKPLVSAICMYD